MTFQLESVLFCSSPKSAKKRKLHSKKFKTCANRNTKRRFLFLIKVTVDMEGEASQKRIRNACLEKFLIRGCLRKSRYVSVITRH